MTFQFIYDEIINLKNFLHVLEYQYFFHSLNANQWIETIYCHFEDATFEWAKNDEQMIKIYFNARHDFAIARMMKHLYQFFENRFAISLSHRVDKTIKKIKQQRHEFIEDYYERVKILFKHVENRNRVINQYSNLDYEQSCCLVDTICWFVEKLKNIKLRRNMIDTIQNMSNENKTTVINLESICITIQLKRIMTKKIRKLRNQFVISQVDVSVIVDEFSFVLKQISCDISKICTVENITNIEIRAKLFASKFVKWVIFSTSSQKSIFDTRIVYESSSVMMQLRPEISEISTTIVNSIDIEIVVSESTNWFVSTSLSKSSFEINIVHEFQSILKKMSCDLSKISTDIVNFSDNESIDEILVSESRKWIIAFAKKKIFVLIVIYEAFSKNSSASYSENIEILIVVNNSFLEHLINENDFVIETFDFDIELNSSSKNSSIQHIENSETMKKIFVSVFDFAFDSIYIYELFAFSVFDFSIDIDFDIYTIDIETIIQFLVISARRKMQLSSFRDFALRNISFN